MLSSTSLSQLQARREALLIAMQNVVKNRSKFGPQELEQFTRWERELQDIDKQASPFDIRHQNAFSRYLRYGEQGLSREHDVAFTEACFRGTRLSYRDGKLVSETRATIGTEGAAPYGAYPGSSMGFVVPVSFWRTVISAAQYTTPWYSIADVITTLTAAPLPIAADDDISNAATAVSEGSAITSTDVPLTLNTLSGYPWMAAVKVSNEAVQDTGFNLETYLIDRFSKRMNRGLDVKYLKGSGSGEPTGALTGLTPSLTALGSADTDGSSPANTIGLRDLVALEQALDPTYRANAKFMMHPNTLAALRNVKDAEKRPVFGGLNNPDGPRLLGYPVVLSPQMDQLQASVSSPAVSKTTVAFGDWSYYKIRLCAPSLRVFPETYALNAQTMYALYWRTDAALIDGASGNRAIVTLANVF